MTDIDIRDEARGALADTNCADGMQDFFRVGMVRDLLAELERLHSWAGLMELLDGHWPEDIFPTVKGDDEKRDAGVRIVSLLRWVDQLRDELEENAGVMNALRRHRDDAEAKLAEIRATVEYWTSNDLKDPRLPQALRQGGQTILAILDGDV